MNYFRIMAYNAAKTLERAVNSVLRQTHRDFRCYLCDNGSTDSGKTRRLVEKYAMADERIVPFYNENNYTWHDATVAFRDLAHHIGPDDCFCVLDADDAYSPTFLEESLTAMREYDCDIVACGSDFYRSISFGPFSFDRFERDRLLPKTMVLEGQRFADYYPIYSSFTKTIWGKLFKGRTIQNCQIHPPFREDLHWTFPSAYGSDTFFTINAFRDARRVVVLARSLHKYYLYKGSASSASRLLTKPVLFANRARCDYILFDNALDYLGKFGEVSPRNLDFLFMDYVRALNTTVNLIIDSQASLKQKLDGLWEIFTNRRTRELAARDNLGSCFGQDVQLRHKLFARVADWLLGLKNIPEEHLEQVCDIGEFICESEEIDQCHIFREMRSGRNELPLHRP